MSDLKPLYDILGHDDRKQELYVSDQKKRNWRSQKGYYSREKGLFNFLQLIKEWEVIVGKMMAKNTIPLKIKSNTLYISTKHSIFAQELGFLVPVILEKIQRRYPDLNGKLSKIKFIHSNYTSHQFMNDKKIESKKMKPKEKLHPFSPEYMEKKATAEKIFDGIEDEDVKKMLTDFMLT
jgi:hypothetical protein